MMTYYVSRTGSNIVKQLQFVEVQAQKTLGYILYVICKCSRSQLAGGFGP